MKKNDWISFFTKLIGYITLIGFKTILIIPAIEDILKKVSIQQFSNNENVPYIISVLNFSIDCLNWFIVLIPIVIFWKEIVYLFKKIG